MSSSAAKTEAARLFLPDFDVVTAGQAKRICSALRRRGCNIVTNLEKGQNYKEVLKEFLESEAESPISDPESESGATPSESHLQESMPVPAGSADRRSRRRIPSSSQKRLQRLERQLQLLLRRKPRATTSPVQDPVPSVRSALLEGIRSLEAAAGRRESLPAGQQDYVSTGRRESVPTGRRDSVSRPVQQALDSDSSFGESDDSLTSREKEVSPTPRPVLLGGKGLRQRQVRRLSLTRKVREAANLYSAYTTGFDCVTSRVQHHDFRAKRNEREALTLARIADLAVDQFGTEVPAFADFFEPLLRRLQAVFLADEQGSWELAQTLEEQPDGWLGGSESLMREGYRLLRMKNALKATTGKLTKATASSKPDNRKKRNRQGWTRAVPEPADD